MKSMLESTYHYKARNNQNYGQGCKTNSFQVVDVFFKRSRLFIIVKVSFACSCYVVGVARNHNES